MTSGPRGVRLDADAPAPADLYDHLHPEEPPMTATLSPEATELVATLEATSDANLLRVYAHLTHRVHATRQHRYDSHPRRGGIPEDYQEACRVYREVRTQRDLVESEVLARMGGAR